MSNITAALVKELREKTGAGMMDCKTALSESKADIEAAVDWLRTKGLAAAKKKSARITAEGLVGIAVSDKRGAIVEINSETDFVARNELFQNFVRETAVLLLDVDQHTTSTDTLTLPSTGRTIDEELTNLISTIGENISIRRFEKISIFDGIISTYIHGALSEGVGKIGVLVALESSADKDLLRNLGKQIAMHIAATKPRSIDQTGLNSEDIERERSVLYEQAISSGRPEAVIQKMVDGRMNKFFEEVCLLQQTFVIDGSSKISDVISAAEVETGEKINITGFKIFVLGEGIEKKEDDFVTEVASISGT